MTSAFAVEYKWESVDVTYLGNPTFAMKLDDNTVTMTPSLSNATTVKTVRVYFPSETQGYLPHYRNTASSGDIINVKYNTAEL